MELLRIQKVLSMAGICSRRRAEEYIEQGYIKVNGSTIMEHRHEK